MAASAPARKRSGWLIFGVTMLVLLVLLILAGLLLSVRTSTVQIRSSNDGATIVPAPQIRQFDPFFYGQSQFPQQNNWPGPTTQPRSGGGFGGGSRIIVTPPNRSPNPSLHKGPTTARSPSIPKVPILPTPAPAPTTVPSGVFEE